MSENSAELELVRPAYFTGPEYVKTCGPEVADFNAEVAGFIPDPEQRLCLDLLFGKREDGLSACFEFAAIAPRQNLKTGLIKQAALAWLFLFDEELVVWSAHEFATTKEAYRDLCNLIEGSRWLSRRVKQTYDSAQDTSILLKSGARLVFKSRTKTGTRGFTGRKLILDEAFALRGHHMGSMVPTLSAMPDGQMVYGSSAGLADSTVLRGVRDRGRKGRGRLGYAEWCAPVGGCEQEKCEHALDAPGCALDRVENLRAANPLLGRRRANGTGMTLEGLQDERATMAENPQEYARERLGWWDDPGVDAVFGPGKWKACAGPTPVRARLVAVAVTVAVDLGTAAIVGVGMVGARAFAQVMAHGPGFDWVLDQLPVGVKVVIDTKGSGAPVAKALKAAHVRLVEFTSADVYDAYDAFLVAVQRGDFLHDDDPVLTASANGAVPQNVGDRSRWSRRNSTADITAIEAATLGHWWMTRPAPEPPPEPSPPQRAPKPTARNDLISMGF